MKTALPERISINPAIMGGRPCIKGTRMTVSQILRMLSAGATTTRILEEYPYLSAEDISAALANQIIA